MAASDKVLSPLLFATVGGIAGLLIAGIVIVELRLSSKPDRTFADRAPVVALLWTRSFHPERLQYLATRALKKNHQLQKKDLETYEKLDPRLRDWLPAKSDHVDKYLRKDIAAHAPIFKEDLSVEPPTEPPEGSFIIQVRVPIPAGAATPAAAMKLLKLGDDVVVQKASPTDTPDPKVKGVVVSGSSEEKSSSAKDATPAGGATDGKPVPHL